MMAVGHMLTSALAGHKILHLSGLSLGICILGSLAPDIDNPKSVLGRILFFISWPLALLGHRTITHSILGTALFGVLIYIIQVKTGSAILLPWLLGYITHLALDMISGSLQLLYPHPQFVGLEVIKTGGLSELIFTIILVSTMFVI